MDGVLFGCNQNQHTNLLEYYSLLLGICFRTRKLKHSYENEINQFFRHLPSIANMFLGKAVTNFKWT